MPFAQIHGTPASVQDRSAQDFFNIIRPRQFISFVMCLHIATDIRHFQLQ